MRFSPPSIEPLGTTRLEHRLVSVDPTERRLAFASGYVAPYDPPISSVPPPDVVSMIDGVPDEVLAPFRLFDLRARQHRHQPRGPVVRA